MNPSIPLCLGNFEAGWVGRLRRPTQPAEGFLSPYQSLKGLGKGG